MSLREELFTPYLRGKTQSIKERVSSPPSMVQDDLLPPQPSCLMHLRSWLLFLGPRHSRTQLERLGHPERKSRIDCARSLPAGPPSDLYRLACHGHRNRNSTGTPRWTHRTHSY